MNGLSNVVDFGEKITAISTKQGGIDEKPNKRGKNTSEKMKTERFHFLTHKNLKGVPGEQKKIGQRLGTKTFLMVQLLCKQNKDMIRVLIFTFRGGQALCPYFAVKFER